VNVGIDIGYSAVKVVSGTRRATFPSVVGSPDEGRFSLNGSHQGIELLEPRHVLVGDEVLLQSRFPARSEDRNWWQRPAYYDLFLAGLSEVTEATAVDLVLVTGLPVAFYADRQALAERLLGEHRLTRARRRAAQRFNVQEVRVIPQPFGSLLALALDERGAVADKALAEGRVGVVDVGGKTTNFLTASRLQEIGFETTSIDQGAWELVRAVDAHLHDAAPGLDVSGHALMDAIRERRIGYFDEVIDLGPVVDELLAALGEAVVSKATELWNGGARLSRVLVTGGGAHLLGDRLRAQFRHAQVVADPVFANAVGYWRLAQRVAG